MEILSRLVNVKNRSDAGAGYTLPDTGVRRHWEPGEIKKNILVSELEQATYVPGGGIILQEYLLINDEEVCDYLGLKIEPEYLYNESDVQTLLLTGTLDQLLDCLDFAPEGVIGLVKRMAVELQINDINKREAIKKATGFDVTAAIGNDIYSKSADEEVDTTDKVRRTKPVSTEDTGTKTRRAEAPTQYKRA